MYCDKSLIYQCETPGNSVKQSQTKTLLVSSCCHKHLKKFSPPFITFSTRIFTPVGKSLHEQRSHRSHLFAALVKIDGDGEASDFENDEIENAFIMSNDKKHNSELSDTVLLQ